MRQIGFVRSVIRRFSDNNGDGNEKVKKEILIFIFFQCFLVGVSNRYASYI